MPTAAIDPYCWIITIPLTLAIVWVMRLPPNSALKALWRDLCRHESNAWLCLTGARVDLEKAPLAAWRRHVLYVAVGGLAVTSLASLAACVLSICAAA